jgi:3-oxoacyl-[acyl-carrier-protein] synthase II
VERATAAWVARNVGNLDAQRIEDWEHAGWLRDRKVGFALVAAAEAWRSAACGAAEKEAAVCLSVGLEEPFLDDFAQVFDGTTVDWPRERSQSLPAMRFRSQVDLASRAVRALLGLRGMSAVHCSACASGGLAVAHAASLIARGSASIVMCGASDSLVNPMGIGGFWRLGAPSPRGAPDACRPFDARRDGLAIGEGAALFVIEHEQRARARGARPLARVLGWGSSQDGYRATAPRPDGSAAARAMKRAIERSRIEASAISYINAHGTGTPLNDPAEARAIHAALGRAAETVPVSSIKGAIGHLMAASGAIEIAACLLPFERGMLPATAHHRELDSECAIDVIGETPRIAAGDVALSNSFGFGGQNVALILGRCA